MLLLLQDKQEDLSHIDSCEHLWLVCGGPQCVVVPSVWWSPVCGGPQCVVDPNVWWFPVCGGPQCVVDPSVWWSPVCGGPQCVEVPNVWWTSVYGGPQCVVVPSLWWSLMCEPPVDDVVFPCVLCVFREAGIACSKAPGSSSLMDSNRAELLTLLSVCFSESLYYSQEGLWPLRALCVWLVGCLLPCVYVIL